jgi:uncharacterized membrane protein
VRLLPLRPRARAASPRPKAEAVPIWALRVSYWLHMAATIIWIGGIFFQAAVLTPVLSKSSAPEIQSRLLESVRRRFDPLAWLSLAVLIATGLTQMSASPHYMGFLEIDNLWSAAILSKHLVIGAMILVASYQTWVLFPQLSRSLLARAAGADLALEAETIGARQARSTWVNLILAFVVLALTAIARTA